VNRDRNSDFDREELGEELLGGDDLGCIDPPGPNEGMGGLTQDELDADYGVVPLNRLPELKNEDDGGYQEFLAHIDGFFIETPDGVLSEVATEDFLSRLQEADSNAVVEIIEFEPE
jgi:hypothetical protein